MEIEVELAEASVVGANDLKRFTPEMISFSGHGALSFSRRRFFLFAQF